MTESATCPVCLWPVRVLDQFIAAHEQGIGAPTTDWDGDILICPGSGQTPGQLVAFDL